MPTRTASVDASRARTPQSRGNQRLTTEERERLRRTVGAQLRAERLPLSRERLSARSGVPAVTIESIEDGWMRPTVGMCWRLARGLADGRDLRGVAAITVRLADAVGPDIRDTSTRPNRRRNRLMAEAREAARGGVAAAVGDSPAALAVAALNGALGTR
jgi:hypothetical protein